MCRYKQRRTTGESKDATAASHHLQPRGHPARKNSTVEDAEERSRQMPPPKDRRCSWPEGEKEPQNPPAPTSWIRRRRKIIGRGPPPSNLHPRSGASALAPPQPRWPDLPPASHSPTQQPPRTPSTGDPHTRHRSTADAGETAAERRRTCSLEAPSKTTPRRGGRSAPKRRRRPPRHSRAAPEPSIYTPERRSGDSPPSRRRSGRRREGNPTDTPAAAGRTRVASDPPLSTVERESSFQK